MPTKIGDKGTLPPGERIRRTKASLAGMYPTALANISRAINKRRPDIESSWRVVEYNEGKPKQQVAISGQLTITEQLRGLSEEELMALREMLRVTPDSVAVPRVESEVGENNSEQTS